MSEAKEAAMRVVREQPDDCSLEDIVRELAFAVMVERGLADSAAGRVISHEEMGARILSRRK